MPASIARRGVLQAGLATAAAATLPRRARAAENNRSASAC